MLPLIYVSACMSLHCVDNTKRQSKLCLEGFAAREAADLSLLNREGI